MAFKSWTDKRFLFGLLLTLAIAVTVSGLACNTQSDDTGGTTGGTTGDDGGNVGVEDALGNEGSISGKVADSQSTKTSTTTTSAAQEVPPDFDTDNTEIRFNDVAGNPLLDEAGQPIDEVMVNADGTFEAAGLPVGVDFTICVDIGRDGDCDIESCVNIPTTDGGEQGRIDDVQADPLTTMVLAKLRDLLENAGIDPEDLPFSPAAVVARIISAYEHLFEETGIDQSVTLKDIEALTPADLAAFFDSVVPSGAKSGMRVAEGNMDMFRAADVNAVALAAAHVFLRSGFPIEDAPGDPDLSSLADLEDIQVMTPAEYFQFDAPEQSLDDLLLANPDLTLDELPEDLLNELPEDFLLDNPDLTVDDLPEDFLDLLSAEPEPDPATAQFDDFGAVIYVSTVAEPNRNFANTGGDIGLDGVPPLPVVGDFILMKMAELHLENRTITLGELYEVLTNADNGLGVRLMYFLFDPNFFGPPLSVFETADGQGIALNLERLFFEFFNNGFNEFDPESFETREDEFRTLLTDLLADTVPPSFETLFKPLLIDRLGTVDDFAQRIRDAKAHLPFSRSGPSEFFVVADADPFRTGEIANAVTVDAELTVDGHVISVTYNANGTGRFFLGFTEGTETEGFVELIVRETGNSLHSPGGPVRASVHDESVFAPINGLPFSDFVSETGEFYPGTELLVIATDYAFESFTPVDDFFLEPIDPIDPTLDSTLVDNTVMDGTVDEPVLETASEDFSGPNDHIFVLSTGIDEFSEPVRVDYDFTTGTATYNPGGRNVLMFIPGSEQTGLFALFNEDTGRTAQAEDPIDFYLPPPDAPDDFETIYNTVDDFSDFDTIDDLLLEFPEEDLLPPPDEDPNLIDGEVLPPPEEDPNLVDGTTDPIVTDDPLAPAEFGGEISPEGFILVSVNEIVGIALGVESFTHVFGTEVRNDRYDSSGDPYFDDLNGNDVQDAGEPTAPFRPTLFDPNDWRSTDIRMYYRRADNDGAVTFEDVAFDSATPMTFDGVALVTRTYLPRLNAFRFGRPNTAVNLVTAFAPPDFFNGTTGMNQDTRLDIFSAMAIINLVMDQLLNVQAEIDIDGIGPLPPKVMLTDAHLWVAPIDDPFILILKGFFERSTPPERSEIIAETTEEPL